MMLAIYNLKRVESASFSWAGCSGRRVRRAQIYLSIFRCIYLLEWYLFMNDIKGQIDEQQYFKAKTNAINIQ